MRRSVLLLAVTALLSGCEGDPGAVLTVPSLGVIEASAYYDENGDGVRGPEDAGISGLTLLVRYWNSLDPLAQSATNAEGRVSFQGIPVGTLRVDPSLSFLGDTLRISQPANNPFTVRPDSTVVAVVGLAPPMVDLPNVSALPVGRRIFTSGIALNIRENFGDGEVHIRLDTLALRATRVDRVGVNPGDSVRIVGRTRLLDGRMTLDSVRIFVLAPVVTLVQPLDVTTAQAASAVGGTRDAWLVQVREALITGARDEGENRILTVDDGSGAVDVVARGYLQFSQALLIPGTTVVRGAGLLRPTPGSGGARWQLFPRGSVDLELRAAPPPPPPPGSSGG